MSYHRFHDPSRGVSLIRLDQAGNLLGRFDAGLDIGMPSQCDDPALCHAQYHDVINQDLFSFLLVSGSDDISLLCRILTL